MATPHLPPASATAPWFANVAVAEPVDDTLLCAIAIDAEEDFNWDHPVRSTDFSTSCMRNIPQLQEIAGAYGAVPTYLMTYPLLESADVVKLVRRYLDRGDCRFGAQLHPWVTPPFEAAPGAKMSYAGNLHPSLEERKLVALTEKLTECLGEPPRIYRAGRYGLGAATTGLLEKHGYEVDTSVAPRTNAAADDGPDYGALDLQPFWFGERKRLLEVPLCRGVVGWGGRMAAPLYAAASSGAAGILRAPGVLTRLGIAERITLSPEGNDLAAMKRLVRRLRRCGQTVFVVSFHSSSLAPGQNPYVRSKADLHEFYDRLSGILDFLASCSPMRFVSLADLPSLLPQRFD